MRAAIPISFFEAEHANTLLSLSRIPPEPRLASEGPTKAKPGRPRYAVVIWLSDDDDDVRKSSARSLARSPAPAQFH